MQKKNIFFIKNFEELIFFSVTHNNYTTFFAYVKVPYTISQNFSTPTYYTLYTAKSSKLEHMNFIKKNIYMYIYFSKTAGVTPFCESSTINFNCHSFST